MMRFAVLGWLDGLWVKTFPFLAPPPYALMENLAEPAVGQWWLLGVEAVLMVFSYLLGEELIFRGILLPKMNGVFGKWDFIANGILFSTYHLHRIWGLPSTLLIFSVVVVGAGVFIYVSLLMRLWKAALLM